MVANNTNHSFSTEFSISKESFIHEFKEFIRNNNSNSNRLNKYRGEIKSEGFKIERYYRFGRYQRCTIIGEGNFSQENNNFHLNTQLIVKPKYKNPFIFVLYAIVFLFLVGCGYLIFQLDSGSEKILSILVLIVLAGYIYFIKKDAEKKGVSKMKYELEREFELIELRFLKKRE